MLKRIKKSNRIRRLTKLSRKQNLINSGVYHNWYIKEMDSDALNPTKDYTDRFASGFAFEGPMARFIMNVESIRMSSYQECKRTNCLTHHMDKYIGGDPSRKKCQLASVNVNYFGSGFYTRSNVLNTRFLQNNEEIEIDRDLDFSSYNIFSLYERFTASTAFRTKHSNNEFRGHVFVSKQITFKLPNLEDELHFFKSTLLRDMLLFDPTGDLRYNSFQRKRFIVFV